MVKSLLLVCLLLLVLAFSVSGKSMPVERKTRKTDSRTKLKIVHGALNTISWGIMMPIGVMMARYLKVFPSAVVAWYYLHLSCQLTAFVIGIIGCITGLELGEETEGIQYTAHRYIGTALFVFALLQVFALCLRPTEVHKFLFWWSIYHKSIGYATITLGIINIFKGFDIMEATTWRFAYMVFIVTLASIAIFLEGFTWYVVLKKKSSSSNDGENKAIEV